VNAVLKRRLGKGAYVMRAAQQLLGHRAHGYRVSVDGAARAAASLIVCRGRHYGGRHLCAPAASVFERRFEVCLFRRATRLDVVRSAVRLGLGTLPSDPNLEIVSAREVAVSGVADEPVQCDGNIICRLPAAFRIADAPIPLVAPPA
jgi:diacylglycerol kinase family enzyme